MKKKLILLGTGGTIAGTGHGNTDVVTYTAAQIGVEEILRSTHTRPDLDVVCEQVAQIDSKDMDFEVWRQLAQRCTQALAQADVVGVVVAHGTDTLEETAYFLHRILVASSKPVVLTCAMRPASALSPDGPRNLHDSLVVASCNGAQGVVVVCNGTIHDPVTVYKQHTTRLDAFSSGDAGPIGYVQGSDVDLIRAWPQPTDNADESFKRWTAGVRWPRVEILLNHVNSDGAIVRALVRDEVDGIVVAGTGNGTLHGKLEAALVEAALCGLRVVRASRCSQGRVITASDHALPHAGPLSPVKARIDLVIRLMEERSPAELEVVE